MLNKTKILLPKIDSNNIIISNEKYKEIFWISRVFLFKNIDMCSEEEIEGYINSLSLLFGSININFTTILNIKESSASDYVYNIQKLLKLANKSNDKVKRVILLSQVDLILKKIGEHKNYFYIVFSDYYYDNEKDVELYFKQKIKPFLKTLSNYHFYKELKGSELVQFLNENYLTKSFNKIYINDKNISKVFPKE